jgi:ribosomal protein S12 methylthiotransferase
LFFDKGKILRGKKQQQKQKVHVITMGCSKNVVDSEKLMAQLRLNDFELAPTLEEADIAVINTCGFIEAARVESIDMIIENVKRKGKGKLKKVYAMGCLTQRYPTELAAEIPEVDRFFGSNDIPAVLKELGADYRRELLGERVLTTPSHTAYLKISEGCDNPCSFCSIPLMRGRHASRPMDEIVQEARLLAGRGVKELVVIGQDTTSYGLDLSGVRQLAELLGRLGDVDGVEWVRLMYAYPAKFPMDVLDVIARHPHVCKYLDLPVQHVSDQVLRSMRRGISQRALIDLLAAIKERVPGIALRTTLIVGYPDEGEKEFAELLDFVNEQKFHRLGVFTYSLEEGTTAYGLGDPVPSEEKERRLGLIMAAQREISLARNEALVGTIQTVLVDRVEGDHLVGRTAHDAPEIDNEVYLPFRPEFERGTFCDVEIVESTEYDLFGRWRSP